MLLRDTICALATPPGVGGLAVIRVSGAEVFSVLDSVVSVKNGFANTPGHTIHYGTLRSGDDVVDTVTVSVFRAPASYTGEDVAEIGCHGGPAVVQDILQTLYRAGARPAEPGEFTKRAFLNGKLDLVQAEAVADLIHSTSRRSSRASARQLVGGFTRRLATMREQLLELCGLLELELDFSEEDVEFVDRGAFEERVQELISFSNTLADSFEGSEILRSGYTVGLVGFPNAGKSSLMNALAGKTRAIVSDMPGTTRDYIEEHIVVDGYTVKLYDTAGIRDSSDEIEIAGIRLAEELLAGCHLLYVVNDCSLGIEHSEGLTHSLRQRFPATEVVVLQNKADIDNGATTEGITSLRLSARTGQGLDALRADLAERISRSAGHISEYLVNERQSGLLRSVASLLRQALDTLYSGASNEFVAIDLRGALRLVGELTGDEWNENILDDVFSRFCIGK